VPRRGDLLGRRLQAGTQMEAPERVNELLLDFLSGS
jgi:hypothetical protein